VTGEAGVRCQAGGVTLAAGGASVMDAALLAKGWMRAGVIRGRPTERGVTFLAVRSQHAEVVGRVGVTTHARGLRAGELLVRVALLALEVRVCTHQRKGGFAVIEGGLIPRGRRMARAAIRAKLAAVFIILCVTGITIHWRAFEHTVLVTVLALYVGMLAFQLERGKIVVEVGGLPSLGRVTRATVCAELSLMGIVLLVAGETAFRRGGEIGQRACAGVTLGTLDGRVLPFEFEGECVMLKCFVEPVDAIVTGKTVRSVRGEVSLHERRVRLLVAGLTNGFIEGGDALRMTIRAGERFPRDLVLVPRQ